MKRSCVLFFWRIYRFCVLSFSYANGTCVKIISFNSLSSGCPRIKAVFIRNLYATTIVTENTNIFKEIPNVGLDLHEKSSFCSSSALYLGCNYYIKLKRRQNANKGRDCEEYYGAIKSRLRSIRGTKGRICTWSTLDVPYCMRCFTRLWFYEYIHVCWVLDFQCIPDDSSYYRTNISFTICKDKYISMSYLKFYCIVYCTNNPLNISV